MDNKAILNSLKDTLETLKNNNHTLQSALGMGINALNDPRVKDQLNETQYAQIKQLIDVGNSNVDFGKKVSNLQELVKNINNDAFTTDI